MMGHLAEPKLFFNRYLCRRRSIFFAGKYIFREIPFLDFLVSFERETQIAQTYLWPWNSYRRNIFADVISVAKVFKCNIPKKLRGILLSCFCVGTITTLSGKK